MRLQVTNQATISELLFEELCHILRIRCERISRDKGPTPDYDIFPKGKRVIVEVKQIDPNVDDRRAQEELRTKKMALISNAPGKRVRKKITDAAPQLKKRAKGKYPSLLVLYSNVPLAGYTDSYAIKTGMYGYEAVVLSAPRDFSTPVTIKDRKFGPKRKMTPNQNTSISGIAVIVADSNGPKELRIYHNIYASIPLPMDLICGTAIKHYFLKEKEPRRFQDWVEIS